jgi:hypothetical protein
MKQVYHTDGRRLVFRFESNTPDYSVPGTLVNRGAYRDNLARIALEAYGDAELHPDPNQDAGLAVWWNQCNTCGYVFGFRDMNQLTNWFMWPDRMAECLELGRIGVYAVSAAHVQDGQFQTCFSSTHCQLIAALPTTAQEYIPAPLYTREAGCTGGVTGWSHGPAYPFSVYGKGRYGVSFAWHVQGPNYDSFDNRPEGWKSGKDAELHAVTMRTEMAEPPKTPVDFDQPVYIIALNLGSVENECMALDKILGSGRAYQMAEGCWEGDREPAYFITEAKFKANVTALTKMLHATGQTCIMYVDNTLKVFMCYQSNGYYDQRVYNGEFVPVAQETARQQRAWTKLNGQYFITQGGQCCEM